MSNILYRELLETDLQESLFEHFNRYQEVNKCWRKESGTWLLKDIKFTETWSQDEFYVLLQYLKNTLHTGGYIYGAFQDNSLVGFASIENELFGSNQEYLQLSSLHTSYEFRGLGIGKKLFALICNKASEMGARKLYISAHSSEESQAFYRRIGCVEAKEYNEKLVAAEPCDCQLEYLLVSN